MSVYRKESNSLVPKAGLGIIDNIFNRFSNHAISNAKTTEALILRNVMYDESDGKLYKVGIDGTKGDEIKMGMPSLDYTNYLHVFDSTAPSGMPSGATYGLTFTATEDCYLFGYGAVHKGGGVTFASINDTVRVCTYAMTSSSGQYIPENVCVKLNRGDVVKTDTASSYLYILKER